MATAPICGMTVAAAIENLAGGCSETGAGKVQAGTPGKVPGTPWSGSIPSSSAAMNAPSFRSSFLATMDAGSDGAIEEGAGTENAAAENQAHLEVPAWKAAEAGSTVGNGSSASSAATSMQPTHSIIGQQGSTSASSGARIPASKPATSPVSQGPIERDAKGSLKGRPGESVHSVRSAGAETGTQAEHPAAVSAPGPTSITAGVASLALPIPPTFSPEAPAQQAGKSWTAFTSTPILAGAETDTVSGSTAAPPLHRSIPDSVSPVAPETVRAADSWVRAAKAPGGNTEEGPAMSHGLLSNGALAGTGRDSVSSIQSGPSSVGATASQSSTQSPASASSNAETGAHPHGTVSNQVLKHGPVQTPEQENTSSLIPNRELTETGEVQPSSLPSDSSQISAARPETAQSHTPHSALPLPAGVAPALANQNTNPSPAISDPTQPAPSLAGETGTQAIEPKLPVAKPGSAGSPRTSAEAPSRSTRWANGVEGASQASSVHSPLPGAPAQDEPVAASVRDPAAVGGTSNAGSQLPASAANSGGSASDTFATIDAGIASGSHTWVHAGARRAEAGFEDPELGWIGVRADTSGGGIHAALIPGSDDASRALGGHLAGLNAYLADRHTPVDTLTLAEFDSRSAGPGTGQQGSETMHQGTGQNDGQGAYSEAQPSALTSTPAIAATVSTERSPQAANQDSTYDPRRPGGTHISVIA